MRSQMLHTSMRGKATVERLPANKGTAKPSVSTTQIFTFALTLILLASVIVGTARVPRAIGYLMGLAAIPMLVQS